MEVPIRFWKVDNDIKLHCLKCGKNYKKDSKVTVCSEQYGLGKKRRMCEGQVVPDLYLDWSVNLLKDYSVLRYGNLDFFEDCWSKVEDKLRRAKTGDTLESGMRKVNVTRELESIMRAKAINIINLIGQFGDLISKSVYILPMGKSKISNFGLDDLQRFEKVKVTTGDKDSDYVGYMTFVEMEDGDEEEIEEETIDNKVEKDDSLTCKACGFEAKSRIGLVAHLRSHEKKITDTLEGK
jgi:hypothetical protein